jgi:hypothetical protein
MDAVTRLNSMLLRSFFVLALISSTLPSDAHDIYGQLIDGVGRSCCDDSDCRPAQYRTNAHGVEMLIDERWIPIPRGKIQYKALDGDPGHTGGGHWCGAPDGERSFFTYCAILPPTLARPLQDDAYWHGQATRKLKRRDAASRR